MQPTLIAPFCVKTSADGLLCAVSTSTKTHDGDWRAVDGQERPNEGNIGDDAQEAGEQVEVVLGSFEG